MLTSMWLMETPIKLFTQLSKSFKIISQRKLKPNRLEILRQMNNWLRYQEVKQARTKAGKQ